MIGPEGKPLEVQIRTREMHRHSEYGVAAHWRYKEGGARASAAIAGFDDKIAWLRQILDWKDAVADTGEWLSAFKSSLFTDSIYVLTPQGKVVDLPRGATPIDFAYAVHTSLGHRCRGARVDGADGAARLRAAERPAGRDHRGEAGRAVARLAQSRSRLRAKPSRAREGAAMVQGAAARRDGRAGARDGRARARAARRRRRSSSTRSPRRRASRKTDDFFAAFARDEINSEQVQAAIHAVAQPTARRAAPRRARSRHARAAARRARAAASSSSASTGC